MFLIFALVFVVIFTMIVPYNMDEFIHYDTILCHLYLGNNYDHLCDPFALNLLNSGLILPLRAFHYSGSFPALYFLPVLFIWNSPLAARLLGLLFLMTGGAIAARAFGFRPRIVVPALMLTFPYLFQHLVDTGPVGIHILFVFLLYVLLDRWCAKQRWRTIITIALVTFAGLWTKLVFFWFAPGLLLFLLIHIVRNWAVLRGSGRRGRFVLQGAVALMILGLLMTVLLLSTAADDSTVRPFLDQIMSSQSYSLSEMLRGTWIEWSPSWYAFLHPLEATQRVYEVMLVPRLSRVFWIIHYLFVPFILLLLALFARGLSRRALVLPAVLYVSFLLTLMMIIRTQDSWAMHHAILSYPFLILATLATIRVALGACASRSRLWLRAILFMWGATFIVVNLFLYALFPTQTYQFHNTPQKHMVQRIINTGSIPDRTMVLTLDWGMYYYAGLFGSSNKSVLFEWGMNAIDHIEYMQDLARENNRKIVLLYTPADTSINAPLLRWIMQLEPCAATPPDSDWVMLTEPDEEIREVCQSYAAASSQPSLIRRLLLQASLTN
ncbi:MAG: hypothetical protein ABIG34_00570 [Candidatus Peregrinibacteria bacterium]